MVLGNRTVQHCCAVMSPTRNRPLHDCVYMYIDYDRGLGPLEYKSPNLACKSEKAEPFGFMRGKQNMPPDLFRRKDIPVNFGCNVLAATEQVKKFN